MASKRTPLLANRLHIGISIKRTPQSQCRLMTTEACPPESVQPDKFSHPPPSSPKSTTQESNSRSSPSQRIQNPFIKSTTCTLYDFPSFEPSGFTTVPGTHLLVPLRRDILHRAVIFEGDSKRQGTASTKWRSEVHGSNRKVRPQKGSGRARLGDKKNPMLRGGGVAFGPKPRDFSTELPNKIYDLAWRMALSYRYRMGQLLLLKDKAELHDIHAGSRERFLRDVLRTNRMGYGDGRTLFVTLEERENLRTALAGDKMGKEGRVVDVSDIDVKDLLELGRVVMEKAALFELLRRHQRDVLPDLRLTTKH